MGGGGGGGGGGGFKRISFEPPEPPLDPQLLKYLLYALWPESLLLDNAISSLLKKNVILKLFSLGTNGCKDDVNILI